jgi:hypothetical protein
MAQFKEATLTTGEKIIVNIDELDALDSGRDDDPLCQRSRCPDQGDARTPDDE